MKDKTDMTREELTEIARRIYEVDGTDRELSKLTYRLKQYARSGKISDYIFFPKPGDPPRPSIEQIVEKAIELRNARPNVFLMPPPKSPSKA